MPRNMFRGLNNDSRTRSDVIFASDYLLFHRVPYKQLI